MPRKARILLPNLPHHIVQRGHNRQTVFSRQADFQYYLKNLVENKLRLGIKIYSFCLMTNHIHLILDPGDNPFSISVLMKIIAGRQTRYVNKYQSRSGTLWGGRFKASPIERDAYLLQCCRYVERNPLVAGMVTKPEQYRWSSYRARIGRQILPWLDVFPTFNAMGKNENRRIEAYRAFVESDQSKNYSFIKNAVQRNQLTGSQKFIEEVERKTGIRVEHRKPGRITVKGDRSI